jgi:CheY-like chemotaxis protein
MRLLWVENHEVFARTAGRQFLADHELTVVASLAGAKEMLASCTFDAVLLDYDLDDGKGASLVAFIRDLPKVPVIVAASAHEDGNALLLAAGADAACPKGEFAQILTVLARVVRANQATRDAPE